MSWCRTRRWTAEGGRPARTDLPSPQDGTHASEQCILRTSYSGRRENDIAFRHSCQQQVSTNRRRRSGPARDRRKRCRLRRRTTHVRGTAADLSTARADTGPGIGHPHAVSAGDSPLACSPLRRLTTAYDDDCTVGPVEAGEPEIERPAHVRGRTAVPPTPGAGTVDDREACLDERIGLDHAGKRATGHLPRHSHVLRVGVRPPSSRRGGGVPPRPRGWPTAPPCAVAGRCCCR